MLNNCQVALQLRPYNKRHDKILAIISELAQSYLPDDHHLTADLREDHYDFPRHIVPTNLHPDLLLWSDTHKALHIIELTICFESGFDDADGRKANCYSELAAEAHSSGYRTDVLPVQIGSRGVLNKACLDDLRRCLLPISPRKWKEFLLAITTAVIEESHRIWCDRNKVYSMSVSLMYIEISKIYYSLYITYVMGRLLCVGIITCAMFL